MRGDNGSILVQVMVTCYYKPSEGLWQRLRSWNRFVTSARKISSLERTARRKARIIRAFLRVFMCTRIWPPCRVRAWGVGGP